MPILPTRYLSEGLVIWALSIGVAAGAQSLSTGAHRPTVKLDVLEQQLKDEFTAAGTSLRDRLAREAAGDFVGAKIAAQIAENHRARFLDLKREIARLTSAGDPPLSVAVDRSPFTPDGSWAAQQMGAIRGDEGAPAAQAFKDGSLEAPLPAWDMYRPIGKSTTASDHREDVAQTAAKAPVDSVRSWGMFGQPTPSSAGNERRRSADSSTNVPPEPVALEPPTHPFFVYRNPQGVT